MQFENPMTFVRSLKGAPVSILMAFFFARKVLTALELQQWTGYKGDNITEAVRLLVDLGWLSARSSRGPWCLAEGRQLPLMNLLESETLKSDESDLIGVRPDSSSSSISGTSVPSYREEEEEEGDESDLIGVVAALDAAGIREPKRSRLKKLKHVTVELINAHVAQGKSENVPLGTVIFRIENNWTPEERFMVGSSGPANMVRTILNGRNTTRLITPLDIVQEVASFTGHREECRCMDCTIGRSRGISSLCPDCKRYRCECNESENT